MSLFDLIVLGIIIAFTLFGLFFGLVHTLGSLLGTIVGVYLASRFYQPLALWLIKVTGWNANFSKVIMFTIAFILINRLVGLVFLLLDRALSIVTKLPIINSLNKLLGGIFGFLEGVMVLGIFFYFVNKFPLSQNFMNALAQSKLAPFCIKISSILWPFIPQALKLIKDTLSGII